MENIEIGQDKPKLEFLDINKGDTYTIQKWGEVYDVRVDAEPTNPEEISLRRTTPGPLHGQILVVSLDDLNRILVKIIPKED